MYILGKEKCFELKPSHLYLNQNYLRFLGGMDMGKDVLILLAD